MDRLKKAKEERVEKEQEFEALVNKAKTSALSDEDTTKIQGLESELQALETEISNLESVEKRAGAIAARKAAAAQRGVGAPQDNEAENTELTKIGKRVSIFKVMSTLAETKGKITLDGAEAEMHQEANKEALIADIKLSGQFSIPQKLIQIQVKKSLLDVATEGADVVETELRGLIPILKPEPIVGRLGITVLNGLRGDVQFPRQTGDVAFAWETETSDVNETTPTLDNIQLSPKRFGGYVDVSMQMMKQSSFVVEPWLRNILTERYALTVDTAILAADGTSNAPTGILYYPGVNEVSLGSSGGAITYGTVLEMMRLAKADNARIGNMGFITNANGEFALARTPRQDSGVEGNFIYIPDIGTLIGRPLFTSELIPSDLTDTGGGTNLSAMIYSTRWQSAIAGFWGGMDLLYDPYTQKVGGKERFVVNAFMDVDLEHPEEFVIIADWDTTSPALT